MKQTTKLERMQIKSFRGLKNVSLEFGDRVTLICGKNGTSKSTILGIVAQIFSFATDYSEEKPIRNGLRKYKTLFGKTYESVFSEHFRFSEKFDLPGSMDVAFQLYDGIENIQKNNLRLRLYDSQDRSKSRPVLRGNKDRNVTHPVIYLSVNRLTPIVSRDYDLASDDYIEKNRELALKLSNKILLQESTVIDATKGSLNSLAPHTDSYDFQSISVGEDNVGQIIRALLSFKKLKETYANYAGGLLLIDEADAGLFPAAQIELFDVFQTFCRDYGIQVIMTSHSPTLLETIYNQKDTKSYKINYLTDTYGKLEVKENFSWREIEADLHVKTKPVKEELSIKFPRVNVYCEDIEAREFFRSLIRKRNLTKIIKISEISLGSEQLMSLAKEKVPEFFKMSVVVLDGDKKVSGNKNFCQLPGELPPDQLLVDYLMSLPDDADFWDNRIMFTKTVFRRLFNKYFGGMRLSSNNDMKLSEQIAAYRKKGSNETGVVREKFKKFYKDEEVQKLFKLGINRNPFVKWKKDNFDAYELFEHQFIEALKYVLFNGYRVSKSVIDEYFGDC